MDYKEIDKEIISVTDNVIALLIEVERLNLRMAELLATLKSDALKH